MTIRRWMLTVGFAVAMAPYVMGADVPTKPWKNAGELSAVSTNGNSRGTTTSAKDTFSIFWDMNALDLIAGGLGSRSGNQVTAEQYNASERMTHTFIDHNYVFERCAWDKNRFAGIRNRYDGSAGVGRILFDLQNDKLTSEVGAGYIDEERTDDSQNKFPSGRAYGKYTRKLSATANFTQDAEYLHNFTDRKDYRLAMETALIASLSTHLSLKASYIWKRVAKPPPGFGKDDTTTSVALIINY